MKFWYTSLLISFFLFGSSLSYAQSDTLLNIQGVEIKGSRETALSHSIIPEQQLNRIALEQINGLQASDAIKHFSGALVKDYGGVGGLKTVSIRSLGSSQTGFIYDGVPVTDISGGQIDMGKYTLTQVEEITLANGQISDLLQPAQAFASAAVISIQSQKPIFDTNEWLHGAVNFQGGSFHFYNPDLFIALKPLKKWTVDFHANLLHNDGDYPYEIQNGSSTIKDTRKNSSIRSQNYEGNILYDIKPNQELQVKYYHYHSYRDLPGAVIFYNPYNAESLTNKDDFLQAKYLADFPSNTSILYLAKYTSSNTYYTDSNPLRSYVLENNFFQKETYASANVKQKLFHAISLSLSNDIIFNNLKSNIKNFAQPSRQTWLSALSAQYKHKYFELQGNVLSHVINNQVKNGKKAEDFQRFAPALFMAVKPWESHDLQCRLFYKEVFRMPTFNELYYTDIANITLQPEIAHQYNMGITYANRQFKRFNFSCSADAYYNLVDDKIIAVPQRNLFIWSMMNYGKVDIRGIDFTWKSRIQWREGWKTQADLNYTFQQAIDISDPDSKLYGQQIPYTPQHVGAGSIGLYTPWLDIHYNIMFSGKRYALGENTTANELKAYADQSISFGKSVKIKNNTLTLGFDILNFMNTNYEVVRFYPMPGRSYRVYIGFVF